MLLKKPILNPCELIVLRADAVEQLVARVHHYVDCALTVRVADGQVVHNGITLGKIDSVKPADDGRELIGVLDLYGIARLSVAVHFLKRSACRGVHVSADYSARRWFYFGRNQEPLGYHKSTA